MKKTLILCAAALELVSLSACGSKAGPDKPQVAETRSVEERRAIAKKIRENSLKAKNQPEFRKSGNRLQDDLRATSLRRRHNSLTEGRTARFAPANRQKSDVQK